MSRTDKTRPFWVKVLDHGVENHDHRNLGKEVWRTRAIKDENGDFVFERITFYYRASAYLSARESAREAFGYYLSPSKFSEEGSRLWWDVRDSEDPRNPEKIGREARKAVQSGDRQRLIAAGTILVKKTERYLDHVIPDHCTIEEAREDLRNNRNTRSILPCTIEYDYATEPSFWRCNCSMCRGSDPSFESSRRRNKRDQLRKVVKLANSGEEDWEDGWNDLRVTTPVRYNTEWC